MGSLGENQGVISKAESGTAWEEAKTEREGEGRVTARRKEL